jgi:hypothetical protein
VVDLVDPEQRCIADAVADARIAHMCPEPLVAPWIGRAQPDMAEAGDAGIARGEIAPAAVFGPHHQLDRIAGGVAEKDHVPDLAHLAFLRRPAANAVAQSLKLCTRLMARSTAEPPGNFT